MSEAIRFADLIAHEIGGGWGEEAATDASPDGAFVIRGTDIPRALVGDVSTVPYRFHKTSNLRSRALRPLDIVFEVSGGSKGQPVGRALLVSQRLLDTLGAPTMCASFCKLIRLDPQTCDPRFVFRRLQHEYATGGLDSFQVQSTGITNFRWKPFLDQFEVVLPPRSVQERVADVLEAIDDLIENNRRRVELLEEMARAIYREWFVHFRYPGHEDVPLVDSPLGPIPDGWSTPRLADLVRTQYGYTESATNEPIGPRYLRGMDINKRSFVDWSAVPYCPISIEDYQKFKVREGDVFVIRMADPGKVGICEVPIDAVFASYLVRLRPIGGEIDPYFLFFTLSDETYQGWVTGASTGATRKSVSAKVMTEPEIVLPTSDRQQQFRDRVEPLRMHLNSLVQQSSALAAVRDLILPKLVTGEIDVSRLDLDELVEEAVSA